MEVLTSEALDSFERALLQKNEQLAKESEPEEKTPEPEKKELVLDSIAKETELEMLSEEDDLFSMLNASSLSMPSVSARKKTTRPTNHDSFRPLSPRKKPARTPRGKGDESSSSKSPRRGSNEGNRHIKSTRRGSNEGDRHVKSPEHAKSPSRGSNEGDRHVKSPEHAKSPSRGSNEGDRHVKSPGHTKSPRRGSNDGDRHVKSPGHTKSPRRGPTEGDRHIKSPKTRVHDPKMPSRPPLGPPLASSEGDRTKASASKSIESESREKSSAGTQRGGERQTKSHRTKASRDTRRGESPLSRVKGQKESESASVVSQHEETTSKRRHKGQSRHARTPPRHRKPGDDKRSTKGEQETKQESRDRKPLSEGHKANNSNGPDRPDDSSLQSLEVQSKTPGGAEGTAKEVSGSRRNDGSSATRSRKDTASSSPRSKTQTLSSSRATEVTAAESHDSDGQTGETGKASGESEKLDPTSNGKGGGDTPSPTRLKGGSRSVNISDMADVDSVAKKSRRSRGNRREGKGSKESTGEAGDLQHSWPRPPRHRAQLNSSVHSTVSHSQPSKRRGDRLTSYNLQSPGKQSSKGANRHTQSLSPERTPPAVQEQLERSMGPEELMSAADDEVNAQSGKQEDWLLARSARQNDILSLLREDEAHSVSSRSLGSIEKESSKKGNRFSLASLRIGRGKSDEAATDGKKKTTILRGTAKVAKAALDATAHSAKGAIMTMSNPKKEMEKVMRRTMGGTKKSKEGGSVPEEESQAESDSTSDGSSSESTSRATSGK